VCAALLVAWHGCSTISVFDQYAYTQATSLKVDALALMDKATGEAALHNEAIEQLLIKVDKAYEYEKGNLSQAFIEESKELVAEAFDLISSLESRKIKEDEAAAKFGKFFQ
jgi:hypothetical protein